MGRAISNDFACLIGFLPWQIKLWYFAIYLVVTNISLFFRWYDIERRKKWTVNFVWNWNMMNLIAQIQHFFKWISLWNFIKFEPFSFFYQTHISWVLLSMYFDAERYSPAGVYVSPDYTINQNHAEKLRPNSQEHVFVCH